MTALVDAKEATKLLGLKNEDVTYRLSRLGILPTVKIGKLYRYSVPALEEFVRTGGKGLGKVGA